MAKRVRLVERPGFRWCPRCKKWIQYPCLIPETHMGPPPWGCGTVLKKKGPPPKEER